jgi:hypothetical protein
MNEPKIIIQIAVDDAGDTIVNSQIVGTEEQLTIYSLLALLELTKQKVGAMYYQHVQMTKAQQPQIIRTPDLVVPIMKP